MVNKLSLVVYKTIEGDKEETSKAWKFLFDKVMQKRLERTNKAIFSKKQETVTNFNQQK